MNGQRRSAAGLGLVVATLVLGACSTHRAGPVREGLVPRSLTQVQLQLLFQDANRNGVRDQDERVLSVKPCRGDPCDLNVSVVDPVVAVPGIGTDCGVRLDFDIVTIGPAVSRIGWNLRPPADNSPNVFRFVPLDAKDFYGVYLYAETGRQRFVPSQPTASSFVLTPRSRAVEGLAYGVYLQWKPRNAPDSDYKPCIGLDPVIVEHN